MGLIAEQLTRGVLCITLICCCINAFCLLSGAENVGDSAGARETLENGLSAWNKLPGFSAQVNSFQGFSKLKSTGYTWKRLHAREGEDGWAYQWSQTRVGPKERIGLISIITPNDKYTYNPNKNIGYNESTGSVPDKQKAEKTESTVIRTPEDRQRAGLEELYQIPYQGTPQSDSVYKIELKNEKAGTCVIAEKYSDAAHESFRQVILLIYRGMQSGKIPKEVSNSIILPTAAPSLARHYLTNINGVWYRTGHEIIDIEGELMFRMIFSEVKIDPLPQVSDFSLPPSVSLVPPTRESWMLIKNK